MTRVDFVANSADSTSGGGMYINCDGSLTDCTFTGNYAGQEGGGIYSWGSYLDMNDCTFTLNDGSAGGGIYGEDALFDMDGGSFNDNVAGMGGGVCVQGGLPMFTNVDFAGDSAYIYGGGLASFDALAQIEGCSFTGEYAWTGAGIYCDGPSAPTIESCTLSDNVSEVGGCALLADDCDPSITNTIVAFTVDGAGMGCEFGASPTTTHSCFYGNDLGDGLCGSHSNNLSWTRSSAAARRPTSACTTTRRACPRATPGASRWAPRARADAVRPRASRTSRRRWPCSPSCRTRRPTRARYDGRPRPGPRSRSRYTTWREGSCAEGAAKTGADRPRDVQLGRARLVRATARHRDRTSSGRALGETEVRGRLALIR